jgi:hypothetical protein
MPAVMERSRVLVRVRIPWRAHADAYEAAEWIRDALAEEGLTPMLRGADPGHSILWSEPAELLFDLEGVGVGDAEAAVRRAVQDAPRRIESVDVTLRSDYNRWGGA